MKFRNLASFGKRIEFWIIGEMIKEGHDVYIPMVDDMDIDAVGRKPNGKFIEVQIKARSKNLIFGDAGLFARLKHEKNTLAVKKTDGVKMKIPITFLILIVRNPRLRRSIRLNEGFRSAQITFANDRYFSYGNQIFRTV